MELVNEIKTHYRELVLGKNKFFPFTGPEEEKKIETNQSENKEENFGVENIKNISEEDKEKFFNEIVEKLSLEVLGQPIPPPFPEIEIKSLFKSQIQNQSENDENKEIVKKIQRFWKYFTCLDYSIKNKKYDIIVKLNKSYSYFEVLNGFLDLLRKSLDESDLTINHWYLEDIILDEHYELLTDFTFNGFKLFKIFKQQIKQTHKDVIQFNFERRSRKFPSIYKRLYYNTIDSNEAFHYLIEGLRLISLISIDFWIFSVKSIKSFEKISIIDVKIEKIPKENLDFIFEKLGSLNRNLNEFLESKDISDLIDSQFLEEKKEDNIGLFDHFATSV